MLQPRAVGVEDGAGEGDQGGAHVDAQSLRRFGPRQLRAEILGGVVDLAARPLQQAQQGAAGEIFLQESTANGLRHIGDEIGKGLLVQQAATHGALHHGAARQAKGVGDISRRLLIAKAQQAHFG